MEADVPVAPGESTPGPPTETPEPSLADHEQQFHRPAQERDDDASPAPDDDTGDRARGDDGKFLPNKRAKSAQATPADVPRIQELTRKLREREAELETLRAKTAAPPAPASPRPSAPAPAPASTGQPFAPGPPRLQSFIDQLKPDEDYNVAVERHAEAMANWSIWRREHAIAQQQAERQFAQTFANKVQGARERYADFDDVALNAPSSIPQGSLVDRWIWEHKSGADVLYHFQKHPEDLPGVLALSPLDQMETLALLSQRLTTPPSRGTAVETGSTAPRSVTPAPRPPNPVRTGPMRGGDDPPGDDAPLSAHEKYFYPNARRRP